MIYHSIEPPTKWRAGYSGSEREEFFFSCADCGEKDAEIAGIIAEDPYTGFASIGILKAGDGFYNPAMFCKPCFEKRLATTHTQGEASEQNQD